MLEHNIDPFLNPTEHFPILCSYCIERCLYFLDTLSCFKT